MTNYGLPLRFKAVNLMDGTETLMDDLIELSDGEYIAAKCDSKELTPSFYNDVANFGLYQSTGHHDANGVEVFFGGVLLFGSTAYVVSGSDHIELIKAEIVTDEGDEMLNTQYPWGSPVFGLKIEECVCIGNIYTPPAELERRAQEVRA